MSNIVLLGLDHFDPRKERLQLVLEAERPDVVTVEAKQEVAVSIASYRQRYEDFLTWCERSGHITTEVRNFHTEINQRLWMREVDEVKKYSDSHHIPMLCIDDPLFEIPASEYSEENPPPNRITTFSDLEKKAGDDVVFAALAIIFGGLNVSGTPLADAFLRTRTSKEIFNQKRLFLINALQALKNYFSPTSIARDSFPANELIRLSTQENPPKKILHVCGSNHLLSLYANNRPVSLASILSHRAAQNNLTIDKKLLPMELMKLEKSTQ